MLLNRICRSPTAQLFGLQRCSEKLNRQAIRTRKEAAVSSQIVLRRTKPKKDSDYARVLRMEEGPKAVVRIRKDPRDKMVVLFGGEESHYVGMCESSLDDPQIYAMFEKAEQVFGFNLMDMCLNGPLTELRKTKHLLPCVFMANHTALHNAKQKINRLMEETVAITSSGIGELNALVFNEVISFDDALKYLKVRTDALSLLAEHSDTKSLLIYETGGTKVKFMCKAAKEWCLRKGIDEKQAFCDITHWLHPETKIIGGHREAINFILTNKANFQLRNTINLPYDLAYYSSYLRPVEQILREVLREFTFQEPTTRIHSTIGYKYDRRNLIKNLAEQVCRPVRLERNLTDIYTRQNALYPRTIECSAKRTNSISLRSANFQAYKRIRSVLAV